MIAFVPGGLGVMLVSRLVATPLHMAALVAGAAVELGHCGLGVVGPVQVELDALVPGGVRAVCMTWVGAPVVGLREDVVGLSVSGLRTPELLDNSAAMALRGIVKVPVGDDATGKPL